MPFSRRMSWTYPAEGQDPWYDRFESFVNALDASGFASREDRHVILMEGGLFSFSASTGVLSWAGTIELLAAITGFRWTIAPGNITLAEGDMCYVDVSRAPSQNTALTLVKVTQVPSSDNAVFICIRRNGRVYFRGGYILLSDVPVELISRPGDGFVSNISRFIPAPNSVTGTVETYVGSVYIKVGNILTIRAMLGSQNPVHSASLRMRRFTGATLITTVGGVAGALGNRTVSNVSITNEDWYDMFMFSSDPAGVAICGGVSLETL